MGVFVNLCTFDCMIVWKSVCALLHVSVCKSEKV
jgi:hypothetical protein